MKGHRRAKVVIGVVLLTLAAGAVWRWWGMGSSHPQNVVFTSGTIEATEVDVSTKVSGRILKLLVDEGDAVRAGQVIALIDGREIRAQVAQARGAYEAAQARLRELLSGAREEEIRQAQANLAQAQAAAGAGVD